MTCSAHVTFMQPLKDILNPFLIHELFHQYQLLLWVKIHHPDTNAMPRFTISPPNIEGGHMVESWHNICIRGGLSTIFSLNLGEGGLMMSLMAALDKTNGS